MGASHSGEGREGRRGGRGGGEGGAEGREREEGQRGREEFQLQFGEGAAKILNIFVTVEGRLSGVIMHCCNWLHLEFNMTPP